jgi:gamma-glutamyltranspeptidase/glutathione hydrolase
MTPTIVLDGGRAVVVVGGSGGPRIISSTVQSILNCVLFDMAPDAAVGAPRFHHQWRPDVLQVDLLWTDEQTVAALEALGHETAVSDRKPAVQLIRVGSGGIGAASDPRKGGASAGY